MKMRKAPFRSGPKRKGAGVSVVKLLILTNVVIFIMQCLNPPTYNTMGYMVRYGLFTEHFALISTQVMKGQVYRLVTSMFLHGGFFHLFFNMYGLFLFGTLLEQRIGKKHFLIMYFISGTLGSILWVATNMHSPTPCIGASGALFGVIISTAMFFPDLKIMLLIPPIPMKLKTFAIVFVLLDIFLEFSKVAEGTFWGNIAHLVHIGGAVGGFLYIRTLFRQQIAWGILPGFKKNKHSSSYEVSSGWSMGSTNGSDNRVTQKELDRLLDKISVSGINSLSAEEEDTLRRAREQMQSQRGR